MMRRSAADSILVTACLVACAARMSQAQTVITPKAAPGALDNPLKGCAPYVEADKAPTQPCSMAFHETSWRSLEPQEGKYAFHKWETEKWNAGFSKGKHVVIRVFLDYPHQEIGVPKWLIDKGVKMTPYTDWGGGMSPDYSSPILLESLLRFIKAYGARYDRDPRVAFVELGMLGFWGEWHTYPRDELFASESVQRVVIDAMHAAFPHKPMMARDASRHAGELPWMGYFDDMLPEDTDGDEFSFLARMRSAKRTDNWKVAPTGGEMVPGAAKKFLGANFPTLQKAVESAHFSWVGPYSPPMEQGGDSRFLENSQAIVRRMGYDFRLTRISVSRSGSSVGIEGVNQGVAPFYYPWAVRIGLLDRKNRVVSQWTSRIDLRTWLPGPFKALLKPNLYAPAGRYRLALGIVDPWTQKPAIKFANDLPYVNGWTVLANVSIEKSGGSASSRLLVKRLTNGTATHR